MEKPIKIAGFPKQVLILLWKNSILFRRNLIGTLVECICPIVFLTILVIMRFYIEKINFPNQTGSLRNVLDFYSLSFSRSKYLVLFYPKTKLIENLVANALSKLSTFNVGFYPTVKGSDEASADQLDDASLSNLVALISFPPNYTDTLPNDVQYTIYTQEDSVYKYQIGSIFPSRYQYMYSKSPEEICQDIYSFNLYNLFNALKFSIDTQIIQSLTGAKIDNTNLLKLRQLNCPGYVLDDMIGFFSFFIPLVISIAYMFTMIVTVGNTVTEKQTKMKEYLKILGIKWQSIWLSTWIRCMLIYLLISILTTVLLKITYSPNSVNNIYINKQVLANTHFLIVFTLLITYSLQVATFSLFLSQFFNKPFNAKIFALIIWIFSMINFYDYLPTTNLKYIFCFLPNLALIFAFQVILQFERSGLSLNYDQLYSNIFNDPLNLGAVLAAMLFYSLIYLVLTWYLEKIMPGKYGVPLPFYFPFTCSYWCPSRFLVKSESLESVSDEKSGFENEPKNLKISVAINKLTKIFSGLKTKKVAVKNLTINFYEDQVTGLLGHNGAGKTTTTFMLCGLYPPSSGTATVMDYDLRYEIDEIRSIIGYCPQHDILFDDLTVEEHLRLICLIKGFPLRKINEEIQRITRLLGMSKDSGKKSKKLSGGMKRRLMVGMALTGDSKVIILDEPTSGLDPYNRLKFWELIRMYKKNRTIILTTHFMEEADALSDRIAILKNGEVKCVGSPLFLKNHYGTGYTIRFYKKNSFDYSKFNELLTSYVSDFTLETNVAAEISVSIKYALSSQIPSLLKSVDERKEQIGIEAYSVSSPTMEEVFLKAEANENDEDSTRISLRNVDDKYFESFKEKADLKFGLSLWRQQIRALLLKRLIVFFRRYFLAFVTLMFPVLAQGLICYLVPSSSVLDNQTSQTGAKLAGAYKLDATSYSKFDLGVNYQPTETPQLDRFLQRFVPYRSAATLLQLSSSAASFINSQRNKSLNTLIDNYFIGFDIFATEPFNVNTAQLIAYYSTLAYQTPGVVLNEASNLLLSILNAYKLDKSISTINSPLESRDSQYSGGSVDFFKYLGCFDILPLAIFTFAISIVLAFVLSVSVMHVAREKMNGSKSLQLLSGTYFTAYWASNFIFDYLLCFFNAVLIVGVTVLVSTVRNETSLDIYLFSSWPTLGYVILAVFMSSLSWPLYSYCLARLFSADVTAFVILFIMLCAASFLDVVFAFIQIFTHIGNDGLDFGSPVSLIMYLLRILFCFLFPNVTIKRQLSNLRLRPNAYCVDTLNRIIKTNYKYNTNYVSINEPGIGLLLIINFAQLAFCALIFLGLETKSFELEFFKKLFTKLFKRKKCSQWDSKLLEEDVRDEADRISHSNLDALSQQEPLILNKVSKVFTRRKTPNYVVKSLSFGINVKECFGLLGLNGAGKTTTFRMITGELEPSHGDILIKGQSIIRERFLARRNFGYCPQFDRLPEFLTVKETLQLFADIRGLFKDYKEKIVDDMIEVFGLNNFTNVLVQKLSGGNKRKLSSAIAFLGKPGLVILDEPSTGMDPASKRFLWNIIKKARDLGVTIILSSHSMEECEAICDTLGIMMSGELQCFGTISRIKKKYADGHRLVIKCDHSSQTPALKQFIKENLHNAELEVRSDEKREVSVAEIFWLIEENKKSLGIESYILSQTSLEQIFLAFANKSHDLNSKYSFANANFHDLNEDEIRAKNKKKSINNDSFVIKF